jgi:signal transduction histidine kinase
VQRIINEQWHMLDAERADEIEYEVKILRAVARKAKRVTHSAGLFRDLAVEGKIALSSYRLRRIRYDEFLKMLKESNMDTQHALDDDREIRFRVLEDTFKDFNNFDLKADPDLLEQAANCLLDNAGKYSYSSTRVTVSYGEQELDGVKYMYIAVRNRGLKITPEEAVQCKERDYRGTLAKATTGEGSGIGLWLVDHIMQAHKGHLEIIPTNVEGWTEVRLNFPVSS